MRYADFYAGSEHPRRSVAHRRIAGLDIRLTRMRQGGHALSDPATDELIVGVVLGGDTRCRWTWGDGWNVTEHRRAGDVGITPARTAGQFEVDGDHELLVVGFSLATLTNRGFAADVARDLDFGRLHDAYHRDGASFSLCRRLWHLASERDAERLQEAEAITLRLLALWRTLAGRAPRAPSAVRPLHEAIIRRMGQEIDAAPGQRRSISDWAQTSGMSPEHFCRAFKARTGMSPLRWSQMRRIGLLERRLQDPGADLDDIAEAFGFSSRSHLNRVFAKTTGRTPRMSRVGRIGSAPMIAHATPAPQGADDP